MNANGKSSLVTGVGIIYIYIYIYIPIYDFNKYPSGSVSLH
jgi:hypothetical protein